MLCPKCRSPNTEEAGFCFACGTPLREGAAPPGEAGAGERAVGGARVVKIEAGLVIAERYRLERLLGAGGMGQVFLARDELIADQVALKLLNPRLWASRTAYERFLREARVSLDLNHPGIVRVRHLGQWKGLAFLVMGFIEGETLRERMQSYQAAARRFSWEETRDLMSQALDALAYAHERGVVHRDLKPENMMLAREPDGSGRLVIMDFGLAKEEESAAQGLTRIGATLGTVYYMSPEQRADASSVDHRTDLYALGVIANEMLTGRLGGRLASPGETRPDLPKDVDEWILRALETERTARFADAQTMKTAMPAPVSPAAQEVEADGSVTRARQESAQTDHGPLFSESGSISPKKLRYGKTPPPSPSEKMKRYQRFVIPVLLLFLAIFLTRDFLRNPGMWQGKEASSPGSPLALNAETKKALRFFHASITGDPDAYNASDHEWLRALETAESATDLFRATGYLGNFIHNCVRFRSDPSRERRNEARLLRAAMMLEVVIDAHISLGNYSEAVAAAHYLEPIKDHSSSAIRKIVSRSLKKVNNLQKTAQKVQGQSGKQARAEPSPHWCSAMSPDGAIIATADEGSVYLWKTDSGNLIRSFSLPGHEVFRLSFSPDGKSLLTSGRTDLRAVLWDVATGEAIHRMQHPVDAHGAGKLLAAFSPNGRLIATMKWGYGSYGISIWSVDNGFQRADHRMLDWVHLRSGFAEKPENVFCARFSENSQHLIIGGSSRSGYRSRPCVFMFNIQEPAISFSIPVDGGEGFCESIDYASNGSMLIGYSNGAALHSGANMKALYRLSLLVGGSSHQVAFSQDGAKIAVQAAMRLYLFNAQDGSLLLKFQEEDVPRFPEEQNSLAFSPDGKMLLCGNRLLDVGSGSRIRTFGPSRTK